MANSKNEVAVANKIPFSAYMTSTGVKNRINQIVGDENTGKRFIPK